MIPTSLTGTLSVVRPITTDNFYNIIILLTTDILLLNSNLTSFFYLSHYFKIWNYFVLSVASILLDPSSTILSLT